jgi:hypothetical protein
MCLPLHQFNSRGCGDLGLPNDGPVGRDDRVHAFPSVVGMAMGLSGHRRAYCMMLLGHRTSYSLPRCMRALFDLSQTLQDTISFQHVDKRRGVRVASEVQVELLALLEIPSGAGFLWWPQMSLLGLCGFGLVVFPLSQGTFTLQSVTSLQRLHHMPFIMGLMGTPL